MASGAGSVDDLTPGEYERMLKEALDLKMIPYDIRVWRRYLFYQCGTDTTAVKEILTIHWLLTENFGISVREIDQWCLSGTFEEEVRTIMPLFHLPTHVTTDLPNLWDLQAKACLLSPPDYQIDVDTTRRYFYYIFGMIVWQIYPKAYWVCGDNYGKFDIWYELGYATAYNKTCLEILHRAYNDILSRELGIGTMSFNQFSSLNDLKKMVAQTITDGGGSQQPFRDNLPGFFEKQSTNSEESVWRLRHALALRDKDWRDIAKT